MGGKYYPYFKDTIGVLDGTHIHYVVREKDQMAYRYGRDPKHTTQNVLGVCDFNMRFTFVSTDWEGIAYDCKVLNHAVLDPRHNFPHPPRGLTYPFTISNTLITTYQNSINNCFF